MKVYVFDRNGKQLMPCSPRKARILLKEGKAKVIDKKIFTIQLIHGSSSYMQETIVAVDPGKTIGVAVVRKTEVLNKMQIKLRTDVSELITSRASLRNTRRGRLWYRRNKIKDYVVMHGKKSKGTPINSKPEGWLAPSIEQSVQHHINWIEKICNKLPNPTLVVELARFDAQKIMNPDIQGIEYQQGPRYRLDGNIHQFILFRDQFTCQLCKSKEHKLQVHHIQYRSKNGTDKPENLITLCVNCHTDKNHDPGGILHTWLTDGTFPKSRTADCDLMNKISSRMRAHFPDMIETYGHVTSLHRMELGLEKEHYNDAIAISGIKEITKNCNEVMYVRQVKKQSRQLHRQIPGKQKDIKGVPNPNTTQTRSRNWVSKKEHKGYTWYKNDRVYIKSLGRYGLLTGLAMKSEGRLYDIHGKPITIINSKGNVSKTISYKNLRLSNRNNGWYSELVKL